METDLLPLDRVRWLASFPKSGNTWVRAFLANLLVPKDRPLTLAEISAMPFYTDTDTSYADPKKEFLGKAHHPYSEKRHGGRPAIYIVRDPVDVVPSCANFFGVSIKRMADEVARDWSRHVASWWPHTELVLKYENMPNNFRVLTKTLHVPNDFESVMAAISHSNFAVLKKDEQKNGFVEASEKGGAFFRRGSSGQGREVMTDAQVAKIVKGAGEWYDRLGYSSA
jgi:hypothetical protein|tara:strand:+ start:817 stop:1491 length:675 start_codon:yes stop_codon:yes gene_type:complete